MNTYARIYLIYTSAIVRVIRLLLLVFLIFWIISGLASSTFPKFGIFLLLIFLMKEIFFRYKLSRVLPDKKVSEATDPTDSLTLQASNLVLSVPHPKYLSFKAFHLHQTKMLLAKLGITSQDFPKGEIAWKEVCTHALDVSKRTHGIYITTMDLIVAYLLLVESTSKVLFNAKLKEEDVLQILTWARIEYPQEEVLPEIHLHITGGGLAEGLLTGWTPETKKYTSNYTINLKRRPIQVNLIR